MSRIIINNLSSISDYEALKAVALHIAQGPAEDSKYHFGVTVHQIKCFYLPTKTGTDKFLIQDAE